MAIPSSGPISLTTIQTEFGGSNPIGINEYYAGGAYVSAGTSGTYGAVPSSGQISIRNFYGTTAFTPYSRKATYTANSTLVVPSPVTSVRVKAWGGAGAGGNLNNVNNTYGGGGGFAQADVSVTTGDTLAIKVGGGGTMVRSSGGGGANGGGSGFTFTSSHGAGGGGGLSGVFSSNTFAQVNALVIGAGGGGGAGAAGSNGGGGGGLTGNDGASPTAGINGLGGTQVAGGVGNLSGSALQGGNGTASGICIRGGGGGGYFGGGAGGNTGIASSAGGGGGSSYTKSGATNTSNIAAPVNTGNAANTGDSDYVAGVGRCPSLGANGNAGYVVIYY